MAIRKKGICPKCKQEKLLVQRGLCWNCYVADAEERMPGFLERRNKQKREHYQNNREEILEYFKVHDKKNRAKKSAYKRKWRNETGKEINWNNNRFHTDINYRIYHLFGTYVRDSIRRGHATPKFSKVTGYPFSDLIKHLESKFRNGMSWNNYGKVWNIDHIISRRHFDYKSMYDEQFKAFWALSNVQPLFVKENMRKQEFTEVPR